MHIEDPALAPRYVVIRADVYERIRDLLEPKSVVGLQVPEGIRRSQAAFFRDLPSLLKDRGMLGKYIAYHGDERVKVGLSQTEVVRECLTRGLSDDDYDVFRNRASIARSRGGRLPVCLVRGMKVLSRLPFSQGPSVVSTPDGIVEVKPFQIVLMVSLAHPRTDGTAEGIAQFPAILDTGTNHNFSIGKQHYERWAAT